MKLKELTLMTTGACNLNCPHCSQGAWRKAYREYQMSMHEIVELIGRAGTLGLLPFGVIHVAGGEPTLWENFLAGCGLLKSSARQVVVSSNCIEYQLLAEALRKGLIDRVYCQASNALPLGVKVLRATFPGRINVGRRTVHKPLPLQAMRNVLPARCGCLRVAYFAGRLFQCAGAFPHLTRMSLSLENPRVWCRVDEDWHKFFKGIDPARSEACRVCLANRKVWEKA